MDVASGADRPTTVLEPPCVAESGACTIKHATEECKTTHAVKLDPGILTYPGMPMCDTTQSHYIEPIPYNAAALSTSAKFDKLMGIGEFDDNLRGVGEQKGGETRPGVWEEKTTEVTPLSSHTPEGHPGGIDLLSGLSDHLHNVGHRMSDLTLQLGELVWEAFDTLTTNLLTELHRPDRFTAVLSGAHPVRAMDQVRTEDDGVTPSDVFKGLESRFNRLPYTCKITWKWGLGHKHAQAAALRNNFVTFVDQVATTTSFDVYIEGMSLSDLRRTRELTGVPFRGSVIIKSAKDANLTQLMPDEGPRPMDVVVIVDGLNPSSMLGELPPDISESEIDELSTQALQTKLLTYDKTNVVAVYLFNPDAASHIEGPGAQGQTHIGNFHGGFALPDASRPSQYSSVIAGNQHYVHYVWSLMGRPEVGPLGTRSTGEYIHAMRLLPGGMVWQYRTYKKVCRPIDLEDPRVSNVGLSRTLEAGARIERSSTYSTTRYGLLLIPNSDHRVGLNPISFVTTTMARSAYRAEAMRLMLVGVEGEASNGTKAGWVVVPVTKEPVFIDRDRRDGNGVEVRGTRRKAPIPMVSIKRVGNHYSTLIPSTGYNYLSDIARTQNKDVTFTTTHIKTAWGQFETPDQVTLRMDAALMTQFFRECGSYHCLPAPVAHAIAPVKGLMVPMTNEVETDKDLKPMMRALHENNLGSAAAGGNHAKSVGTMAGAILRRVIDVRPDEESITMDDQAKDFVDEFVNHIMCHLADNGHAKNTLNPAEADEVFAKQSRPIQREHLRQDVEAGCEDAPPETTEWAAFAKSEASVGDPRAIVSNQSDQEGSVKLYGSRVCYAVSKLLDDQFAWYAAKRTPGNLERLVKVIASAMNSGELKAQFDGADFVIGAGDFSRMDAHVGETMRYLERKLFLDLFAEEHHASVEAFLDLELDQKARSEFMKYCTALSRISGSPGTSLENTIGNALCTYMSLRLAGLSSDQAWKLMSYSAHVGDDSLWVIPTRVDNKSINFTENYRIACSKAQMVAKIEGLNVAEGVFKKSTKFREGPDGIEFLNRVYHMGYIPGDEEEAAEHAVASHSKILRALTSLSFGTKPGTDTPRGVLEKATEKAISIVSNNRGVPLLTHACVATIYCAIKDGLKRVRVTNDTSYSIRQIMLETEYFKIAPAVRESATSCANYGQFVATCESNNWTLHDLGVPNIPDGSYYPSGGSFIREDYLASQTWNSEVLGLEGVDIPRFRALLFSVTDWDNYKNIPNDYLPEATTKLSYDAMIVVNDGDGKTRMEQASVHGHSAATDVLEVAMSPQRRREFEEGERKASKVAKKCIARIKRNTRKVTNTKGPQTKPKAKQADRDKNHKNNKKSRKPAKVTAKKRPSGTRASSSGGDKTQAAESRKKVPNSGKRSRKSSGKTAITQRARNAQS